jgi:hypothetical protein
MENKNLFWKYALNYGAVLGLTLIIFNVILYMLGIMLNGRLGWVSYIFIIFITLTAIKKFRESQNNILSYGQGVKTGTMVNVFSGILMAMFTYTLYSVIDPDLILQLRDVQEQALMVQGFSDDEIEMQMQMFEKFNNPGFIAFSSFFGSTIMGLIISLIASIFLKRKEEDNY